MSSTIEFESRSLMSHQGPLVAERSTGLNRSIATTARPWKAAIEKLYSWWNDPVDEEDGYAPPDRNVLAKAIKYAELLQEHEKAPPHRVVQDAGGGIIFERRVDSDGVEKYHFWSGGQIEYIQMKNHKVVARVPMD